METSKMDYSGHYEVSGNYLIRDIDGRRLQLCTRPRPTATKAPSFLIDKTERPTGKYVSSIYGTQFEYGRVRYEITFSDDGREAFVRSLYVSSTARKASERVG